MTSSTGYTRRVWGLTVFMATLLIGCGQDAQDGDQEKEAKGEVELVYVEWSSALASVNVMRALLAEQGYEVDITPVSAAAMWQAVASGDADAMLSGWLPTTHKSYYEKVKGQVENLGPNLEGTRVGLVVPEFVKTDAIPQLGEHVQRFDGKIIGIDPGAGLMSATENVMEAYNLEAYELVEGSGATMTAALDGAIKNNEWVVVTGWTPHWMFARWDLKYLDDPKGIYGGREHIATIVRPGLKQDMPQVYDILNRFHWRVEDMNTLMAWNRASAEPYANAQRWLKENPDKVQAWLGKGTAAPDDSQAP